MIFSQIRGLTRLDEKPFAKESDLRDLIEPSLQKIFPCVIPLKKEFRIGKQGQSGKGKTYKFDMLAFDTERNCFVVIEYKNKIGSHLIEQVWKYMSLMSEPNTSMTDEYLEVMKEPKKSSDFDWDKSYAITVAGDYTEDQMEAADGALNRSPEILKMYTINRFQDNTVIFSRIRGTPVCKTHRRKRHGPRPPGEAGLYEKFNSMVESDSMSEITREEMKHYIKYHLHGKTVCTLRRQKKRLILYYAVRSTEGLLSGDGIIEEDKTGRKYGAKDYTSYLYSSDDIGKAMPYIVDIYNRLGGKRSQKVSKRGEPDEGTTGGKLLEEFNAGIAGICNTIRIDKTVNYIAYRRPDGTTVCAIRPSNSRLRLYYGASPEDNVLSVDDFVRPSKMGRHLGAKDYESVLSDQEDITRAMDEIKKIYRFIMGKMHGTSG